MPAAARPAPKCCITAAASDVHKAAVMSDADRSVDDTLAAPLLGASPDADDHHFDTDGGESLTWTPAGSPRSQRYGSGQAMHSPFAGYRDGSQLSHLKGNSHSHSHTQRESRARYAWPLPSCGSGCGSTSWCRGSCADVTLALAGERHGFRSTRWAGRPYSRQTSAPCYRWASCDMFKTVSCGGTR